MTKTPDQKFQIDTAREEDWPWIVEGQVETIWTRLAAERKEAMDRQALEARIAAHVATLREDAGFPNEAFVARNRSGVPAGYVWVARTHNDSTGQHEASLLNQFVAAPFRGQGLGHRLLEVAEAWARGQGLPRISLSIGVHNTLGQKLYESLGYGAETLRMSKRLGPEPDLDIRLSDD